MQRIHMTERILSISHDRQEETSATKARWFQSLSLDERMEMLYYFTDLILSTNPDITEQKVAQSATGRVQRDVDLKDVQLLELDNENANE